METRQQQTGAIVEQARNLYAGMSQARRVAVAGAGAGLLSSIAPWYGASSSIQGYSGSTSITAWHGWGLLAVLAYIVAGAVALLPALGDKARSLVPNSGLRLDDARLTIGLGGLAILATLIFMRMEGSGVSFPGYSEGPSFGSYLGLLSAVAVVVGGAMLGRESR